MEFMADGGSNPIAQTMDFMGGGEVAAPPVACNKLREWEAKHEEELEALSRKEEQQRRETREKAAAEVAKLNQDRTAERTKRVEVNRTQEKEMETGRLAAMKPGANPWELVASLIDTNARTADESRDTSRMRSLLIQLKSSPP